jgi:hypothetical protein
MVYAVNLTGSAAGCALALIIPLWLGGAGVVMFCCTLAALTGIIWVKINWLSLIRTGLAIGLLLVGISDGVSRVLGKGGWPFLSLQLSPYKSLSYTLQFPGVKIIWQDWNAFSRVDLVRSQGIRSMPGLSFRYLQPLPVEDGLLVDGDDLNPVVLESEELDFTGYLPQTLAYILRPGAEALVLGARGGLDILVALENKAKHVTAVEINELVIQAVQGIYLDPRVSTVNESERSYLSHTRELYDVSVLSLVNTYHPIRSGAYSLGEDYRYTEEAFTEYLTHLKPDGLLVVTRWLQNEPTESLRVFSLALSALEQSGLQASQHIVALRSYNTITLFINKTPFNKQELIQLRQFTAELAFDLVYAPDMIEQEANQYSVLLQPLDYLAFQEILSSLSRNEIYASSPYDVRPPTDDHPFFGHYFKWSQTGQIFAELGRTWQPFGGAGSGSIYTRPSGKQPKLSCFLVVLDPGLIKIYG